MTLLRGGNSIRWKLIRERAAEIRRLDKKIVDAERDIALKVKESRNPDCARGIGFVVTAKILGHVGRFREDPIRRRLRHA